MRTLLRPTYWPGHLAMLVCVAIAVGLGLWQYDAWGQRRADAARDLSNAAPVTLDSLMTGDSPFPGRDLGRQVSFSGSWLGESTLYVDSRVNDGRQGYWVVTPVRVSGSESAIPVVRGWSSEPRAPRPSGDVEVVGWLQATEGSSTPDQDPHDDIIPAMRIASMVEHVDVDLYSGYVVARTLTGAAASGLAPVTPSSIPAVSDFTAARNLFYAFEWWFFGGFAVFIWWRWCRDTLAEQRPTSASSHSVGSNP